MKQNNNPKVKKAFQAEVKQQQNDNKKNTKAKPVGNRSFLQILDDWSLKYINTIFWLAFAFTLVFSLLTFDLKSSVGGDDSEYVIRAADFVTDFKYPSFQGPLYPIILALFIAVAGISLPLLKLVSFVFILAHIFLFFRALKKAIPPFILMVSLLIIGMNAYILYFASQTYSEAFFLALQMFFMYHLFEKIWQEDTNGFNINPSWKLHAISGLFLFLMAITKNIAYATPVALVVFYTLHKAWKPLAISIGSFVGFLGIWNLLKYLIWTDSSTQISAQGSTLLLKHPYDPARGTEDFIGFLERFWDNSGIYLSKHLFTFLGLKPDITEVNNFLVFIVYALFLAGIYFVFRKNNKLLFIFIYLAVMLGATFFALQTLWDSRRLIIIYFPLALIAIFSAFYYAGKNKKLSVVQYILPLIALVLVFSSFKRVMNKVKDQSETIAHNLQGDLLYGFTPDWINFIRMSQYAAQNLPDSVNIGCRKPSISFVYTNRRFYGLYNLPTIPLDSLVAKLSRYGNKYYLVRAQDWEKLIPMQADYMAWQADNMGYLTANQKDDKGNSVATYIFEVYKESDDAERNKRMETGGLVAARDIELLQNEFRKIEEQNKGHEIEISVIDPDDLLKRLHDNNVDFIVDARLRKFEAQKTEYTINTIQRYLFYIQRKYPDKVKLIHRIGDDEEAYLYQIL